MTENKLDSPSSWVDPDDAPELTDAFFERANEYYGAHLIRGWQSRIDAALRDWLQQHPPLPSD